MEILISNILHNLYFSLQMQTYLFSALRIFRLKCQLLFVIRFFF